MHFPAHAPLLHLATLARRSADACRITFRRGCRVTLHAMLRRAIVNAASRRCLNAVYVSLPWQHKQLFHHYCSRLFRGYETKPFTAVWTLRFAGKTIKMPLRSERLWLDWDSAISICGHDIDVKRTYSALLKSIHKPTLFVDIGANYGTHSLLFMAHGIPTITFEPNKSCHDAFRLCCRLNNLTETLEEVALGDGHGMVDLCYPEHETWLGSTEESAQLELATMEEISYLSIAQRPLDDFLGAVDSERILIKIDTEGSELAILKGGLRTLTEKQPLIIFEAWTKERYRRDLWKMFATLDYRIMELPWAENRSKEILTRARFVESAESNFIAVPGRGYWRNLASTERPHLGAARSSGKRARSILTS